MVLELQQASAGSGKTYTLAKKYIWYLITIRHEDGLRRLRNDKELTDAAKRILAVTFTNKATNEMQERIVERLDDLAHMPLEYKNGLIAKPDYMQEFATDLRVLPSEIARTCGKALAILLENYSEFKVSTIDSFFQLVLRTFAYESDLNDTYQVEIDSHFLSKVAVDGMLQIFDELEGKEGPELYTAEDERNARFWIGKLMENGGKNWNIFSRNMGAFGSKTPYSILVGSLSRLQNEDYKVHRQDIEEYFATRPDLIRIYEYLVDKYESPVRARFEELQKLSRAAYRKLPPVFREAKGARSDVGKVATALRFYFDADADQWRTLPKPQILGYLQEPVLSKKTVKAGLADAPEAADVLRRVADAADEWVTALADPGFLNWNLYAANFPFLALFELLNRKREEYLAEENAIELGETSMILRQIIRDDDAPFVYERLGSELDHFLIDEFQDTSRLQWDNMRPLLSESVSRGKESLIIGDAKQSIYRFRNADSTLITVDVPDMIYGPGNRPVVAPSTNYRSELRIVQFNNSFFKFFASRLDAVQRDRTDRMRFADLYENVVQIPKKATAGRGYVEMRIGSSKENPAVDQVPGLIAELTARGYRQKDIAVLVARNTEGTAVIDSIMKYNLEHKDELPAPIAFISEQSLKVANSQAVKFIVGVLENIARGFNPVIREGEERRRKGVGNWNELQTGFKHFALGRQTENRAELLDAFLESNPDMSDVTETLESMNSFAIPALVEMIAGILPDPLPVSDAVYIAAFQDLVIEYCERMPTDIGSFLQWWERKSADASITSPKDMDAVQIMTLHKSKGLEFDCVIVPFANWVTEDAVASNKEEWRWLKPDIEMPEGLELPPYMPIATATALEGTVHEHVLTKYYDQVKTDYINQIYVTFTRAGKELYIFADTGSSKSKSKVADADITGESAPGYLPFGGYLIEFVNSLQQDADSSDPNLLPGSQIDMEGWDRTEGTGVITIGEKTDPVYDDAPDGSVGNSDDVLQSYYPRDYSMADLTIRQANLPQGIISKLDEAHDESEVGGEPDPELDPDPRSEGNIKHAILENVSVPSDLPRSVRRLVLSGLLTAELAAEYERQLTESLAEPTVADWFDGSARVINERPIIRKGALIRRPDRILVYPDGSAVVVDYKFGKINPKTRNRYHSQVLEYMWLLKKTGHYRDVRGFLWYVNEKKVIPVIV